MHVCRVGSTLEVMLSVCDLIAVHYQTGLKEDQFILRLTLSAFGPEPAFKVLRLARLNGPSVLAFVSVFQMAVIALGNLHKVAIITNQVNICTI